jgi:uncharacterized RDD family membrane protein YckC
MTCRYCGTRNDESEHRCGRCGRRPGDTLTPVSTPVMTGATALRLQPVAQLHIQDEREASAEQQAPDFARAYQKPLFEDRKVLTFPQSAPPRQPRAKNPDAPARARKSRPAPEGQGQLEFLPPAVAKPRELGTTVEAVIFCEFPAATPLHRAVAAGLDWSLVLIGYGLFLGTFYLSGGQFAFTKANLSMFGAMFLLISFAYGLCFAWAGTETAGMRFAGLRLTTFDGFPPDRKQRLVRFFGACLTRSTVLGLLWCLADEESLAWQDHISRTFPTPDEAESAIIRRH